MGHPFPPEQLSQANLCPRTGLATDYLNHFNEVAMLIGLLPDMPEAAEDVLAWRPCAYLEHFSRSGFRARDLAVAAYQAADPVVVAGFEAERAVVEGLILEAQRRLGEDQDFGSSAKATSAALCEAISALAAIIAGDESANPQANQSLDVFFEGI